MRIALAAAALAGLMAAQTAAAEAPAASEAVKTAKADANADTAAQIDAYLKASPAIDLPQDKTPGVVSGVVAPRKVHGEAGVSIGTGGYRSAYAISAFPVGKTGTLTVAVQDTRFGKSRGWGYGGPGYGGPGYGGLGYGGGFRGGDRQSLSAAFSFGGTADAACGRREPGDGAYSDPDLDRARYACRPGDGGPSL
ncbi:hypothetical protein [Phenylobacterium sp.]|uniref:hypothetical protein n=1 Tax=Phenylobacterium sp. TaxID=1871053 RepID=UPI002F410BE1